MAGFSQATPGPTKQVGHLPALRLLNDAAGNSQGIERCESSRSIATGEAGRSHYCFRGSRLMIHDLPESIQTAIYEVFALVGDGHISVSQAYELQDMIEQKCLAAEWRAARRTGPVVLSRKAFSDRADRLRRQGVKVMEGPGSTFKAYATTWNCEPNQHGAIFAPGSCSNLEEFVHRGKILFEHDPRQPIGIPFSAENDEYGLLIKGRFLNTNVGRTMRTVIRERLEWGYPAPASLNLAVPCDGVELNRVDGSRSRIITDFRLNGECSYVGHPAHPSATFF
jgi:Caudovirus prohead serine protease